MQKNILEYLENTALTHKKKLAFSQLLGQETKYLALSEKIEKSVFSYFDTYEGTIWCREIYQRNGETVSSVGKGYHINGPFHTERVLLALNALEKTGSILDYMK